MTFPPGPLACVGLGFGDEGKGKVVDALVRRRGARAAIRFGGGPQAAHHVVAPSGRVHCFAQFASGTLVPGVRAFAAREMLVDPLALELEAKALEEAGAPEPYTLLSIDPRCLVVTPLQKLTGQMRELARGEARRGSCGRGVGEAVNDAALLGPDALRFGDLFEPETLRAKLRILCALKLDQAEQLAEEGPSLPALVERLERLRGLELASLVHRLQEAAARPGLGATENGARGPLLEDDGVILEGAHGVLLDATRGSLPHVTPTDTTFAPAERLLLDLAPGTRLFRLGVLRAYMTRHGAGPFPTEDAGLTRLLPEPQNVPNEWQGATRAGWLDLVALAHAIEICGGVDALAVTNLDRLSALGEVKVAVARKPRGASPYLGSPVYRSFAGWSGDLAACRSLEELPGEARAFLRFLESSEGLGVPVALVSTGPSAAQTLFAQG